MDDVSNWPYLDARYERQLAVEEPKFTTSVPPTDYPPHLKPPSLHFDERSFLDTSFQLG
jgi:hypothetical protein